MYKGSMSNTTLTPRERSIVDLLSKDNNYCDFTAWASLIAQDLPYESGSTCQRLYDQGRIKKAKMTFYRAISDTLRNMWRKGILGREKDWKGEKMVYHYWVTYDYASGQWDARRR